MKHVYIFNSSARGAYYGIGTYIKQLVDVLRRTAYNVTVVNIIYQDIEFDICLKDSIRYISIPAPIIPKKRLNNEGFEKSIPFILYPYVDPNEQNIFHLNYMGDKYLAQYLRSLFTGCSIILTVHYTDWSLSLSGNRSQLRQILRKEGKELDLRSQTILSNLAQEKELLAICDKVVAISRHSYRDLIQIHKVDKRKITLINNALKRSRITSDEKREKTRKKLLIAPNEIILLFVGRLDIVKGLDLLINTVKHLIKRYPDLRLIVVGEGDFSKYLSASSPLWTQITFTGFLSPKSLQELYTIADIGIIPSLHEEFGYVAIEMMNHKIPIIANNTTGLSELIDDGINGFKVHIHSRQTTCKELVDKIIYLIENPDIRKNIGEKARNKLNSHYNIRFFEKQMLALYNSL
ncbi:TIGR04157 family glycosyltransferase [uncultured Parabacteroides sp.]|uniref:TIGR04157 family glycosyltransferase n=1 Tax=uncultured Parabacteroides sp. TaxID=512312 RepID=UPI0028046CFA|nr:TIGR04157 family glycosyltransferase [uncultured Parabacteroides sp.]